VISTSPLSRIRTLCSSLLLGGASLAGIVFTIKLSGIVKIDDEYPQFIFWARGIVMLCWAKF
jgi:hypothetical protein